MIKNRKGLLSTAALAVLLASCASCSHTPKQTIPLKPTYALGGDEWLSWTPTERNKYVYGYIVGYQTGFDEACRAADSQELLKDKMPFKPGDENFTNIALSHCFSARRDYPRMLFTPEGGATVSPYPEIITEMYEKYHDSRPAPYQFLMELLSKGQATTAEELYKAQQNKWPNARIPS